MTAGEKIKHFRNLRGISQETLGQLSDIISATIKKYEYGNLADSKIVKKIYPNNEQTKTTFAQRNTL